MDKVPIEQLRMTHLHLIRAAQALLRSAKAVKAEGQSWRREMLAKAAEVCRAEANLILMYAQQTYGRLYPAKKDLPSLHKEGEPNNRLEEFL